MNKGLKRGFVSVLIFLSVFVAGTPARAAVEAPGESNRLVLLAHSAIEQPERMSLEGAGASRQEGK
jgi:hypothetical protein